MTTTVIGITEAARILEMSPKLLTQLLKDRTMFSVIAVTDGGEPLFDKEEIELVMRARALRDKLWREASKYERDTTSLYEARIKYGLSPTTVSKCVREGIIRAPRGGYSAKGGRGKLRPLNLADVMYVSLLGQYVRKQHGGNGRGHSLFDNPALLPPHVGREGDQAQA